MLPVKVIWDYTYYWGVLSQFFFQRRLTDLAAMGALREDLALCQKLNVEAQAFFRAWSAVSEKRNPAVMLDQAALPWFVELNRGLNDTLDDAQFRARVRASTAQLKTLAAEMLARACAEHPSLDGSALRALVASHPGPAEGATPMLAEFS